MILPFTGFFSPEKLLDVFWSKLRKFSWVKKEKKIVNSANDFLLTEFFHKSNKMLRSARLRKNWLQRRNVFLHNGQWRNQMKLLNSVTIDARIEAPGGYSLAIALYVYVAPKGMVFASFWSENGFLVAIEGIRECKTVFVVSIRNE